MNPSSSSLLGDMGAFAIVTFVDSNENAVVPVPWIILSEGKCVWPPKHLLSTITKLMEREVSPIPSETWESFDMLIMSVFATYREARSKLGKSTETSDLGTTDPEMLGPGMRKKKVPRKLAEDTSSVESDSSILEEPPFFPPPGNGMTSTPLVEGITKDPDCSEDPYLALLENCPSEETGELFSASLLPDASPNRKEVFNPLRASSLPDQRSALQSKKKVANFKRATSLHDQKSVLRCKKKAVNIKRASCLPGPSSSVPHQRNESFTASCLPGPSSSVSHQRNESFIDKDYYVSFSGPCQQDSTVNEIVSSQTNRQTVEPIVEKQMSSVELGTYLRSITRDISILKTGQRLIQESLDTLIKLQSQKEDEGLEENLFQPIAETVKNLPLKTRH